MFESFTLQSLIKILGSRSTIPRRVMAEVKESHAAEAAAGAAAAGAAGAAESAEGSRRRRRRGRGRKGGGSGCRNLNSARSSYTRNVMLKLPIRIDLSLLLSYSIPLERKNKFLSFHSFTFSPIATNYLFIKSPPPLYSPRPYRCRATRGHGRALRWVCSDEPRRGWSQSERKAGGGRAVRRFARAWIR